jgi:drug/metabolite transporter (DMT)-like permease
VNARLGLALVGLSAIAWSTAGIFTKGIAVDVWIILFWRGLFSAVFIAAYVAARRRGRTISDFAGLGVAGWAAATVGALATVCYLSAFKLTSVTNVVVIYATTPFIAAGLVWLASRESTDRMTLAASAAALVGVVVMVGGSLGTPNLLGDGLALAMAILMATMMVLIRAYPSAPMVPAMCVSSLQIVVLALVVSDPFAVSVDDLAWLTAFGLVQAAAVILLTEGTRRIPASHAALIGTIDIPLAPLWALLLLGEAPTLWSVAGGVIVTSAVLAHMANHWKTA